jgi:CxxC motif-containing protein (DUF1111 family)
MVAFSVAAVAHELADSSLSGGVFTVRDAGESAYGHAAPDLSAAERELFERGKEEFFQRWVVPFNIGGHWGRGPLSNGEECSDCHAGNGRGSLPDASGGSSNSLLVRLSVPGTDEHGGPLGHPFYGTQLQETGVLGKVAEEGRIRVVYSEREIRLSDGEVVQLRDPRIEFRKLNYGPLKSNVMLSARVAPPVFGLGLLEAVPEEELLRIAAEQQRQGFNGRLNYVWDVQRQATVAGRFGLKANQPSLRQQAASAYLQDLGVTSRLFLDENCTAPSQKQCLSVPSGGKPEVADSRLDALIFYLRALAVPARRNLGESEAARGEKLFAQAQCAACHVPELKTGAAPFVRAAEQVIRPYTDLLLHDMGEELADGRPDYLAGSRDWRTAPLWGIGLTATVNGNAHYLHDGRARTLTEAIVWHGGEALAARDTFIAMPRADREALLAFLRSL